MKPSLFFGYAMLYIKTCFWIILWSFILWGGASFFTRGPGLFYGQRPGGGAEVARPIIKEIPTADEDLANGNIIIEQYIPTITR